MLPIFLLQINRDKLTCTPQPPPTGVAHAPPCSTVWTPRKVNTVLASVTGCSSKVSLVSEVDVCFPSNSQCRWVSGGGAPSPATLTRCAQSSFACGLLVLPNGQLLSPVTRVSMGLNSCSCCTKKIQLRPRESRWAQVTRRVDHRAGGGLTSRALPMSQLSINVLHKCPWV